MKTYYFISGLPRSGSTLLSSILKQNPEFYADIASPIQTLIESSVDVISCSESNSTVPVEQRKNLIYGIFDGYYKHIEKNIIFDSSRKWTNNTNLLKDLFPYTKILCTVRDIVPILNSFECLFNKNSFYTKQINEKIFSQNIFIRTDEIFEREILDNYFFMVSGYELNPDMLFLIEYDDLCKYPEKTMKQIYNFLDLPYYSHNFENVNYSNEKFDDVCKVKDLHLVRNSIVYDPPKYILPSEVIDKYEKKNMEFWKTSLLNKMEYA